MKIYILHECYLGPITYHQHDTPDLPPNIAIPLIDSGFANVYGGGVSTASGEPPSGWVNNDTITVTASPGAGGRITLTSTGEKIYYVWRGKVKSVVNGWTSEALNFSAGQIVWLYSHDGKTFHWSLTPPALDDLWVAAMIPGLQFAVKLIYGVQDATTRDLVRKTVRAIISSGGGLTADTYALHTDTDAATTPGFELAMLRDVDINTSNAAWLDTKYTWLWFEGASNVNFDKDKTFPFKIPYGGTHPIVNTYDSVTGFSWVEASTLKYLNYWVVRIPVTADVTSQNYRTVILQPQRQYNTLLEAQSETPKALNLGLLNDLKYDCVFSEILTYVTDLSFTTTGKVQLADYRGNLDDVEGWLYEANDKEGNPVVGRVVNPGSNLVHKAGDRIQFSALPYNEGISISAEACVYSGATNPTAELGVTGDYFLNFIAGTWLEKINQDTWQLRFTFNAGSFYSGSGALPDAADYKANDHYFLTDVGKLYKHFGGVWTLVYTVSSVTPAGNNGEVQWNNNGVFGADGGLTWDNTNKKLTASSPTNIALDVERKTVDTANAPIVQRIIADIGAGTPVQNFGATLAWYLSQAANSLGWGGAITVSWDDPATQKAGMHLWVNGSISQPFLSLYYDLFEILTAKIKWTKGTPGKWLKLNANKEIECVDAPEAGATSYIELTDTSDTSYTGKDKYVPVVDETNGELDLTESVVATFDLLSDTPASKTGQGGKIVKVNSGGTALEYVSGASGTFTTADSKTVTVTNGIITSIA